MNTYKDEPETWADVMDFIRAHRLDMDEYFHIDGGDTNANNPVWMDGVRWIACFAVRGTNEGWYVHVEQIGTNERVKRMVGKFWTSQAAYRAARLIADYIYSNLPYSRHIVVVPARTPVDKDDWYRQQAWREYQIEDVMVVDPDAPVEHAEQEHWYSTGSPGIQSGAWVTARIWVDDPPPDPQS